jgi:hypothetical protein
LMTSLGAKLIIKIVYYMPDYTVVEFERRLERTGKAELIQSVCVGIRTKLRQRHQRRRGNQRAETPLSLEYGKGRTEWAAEWAGTEPTKEALLRQWKHRWRDKDQPGRRGKAAGATPPAGHDPFNKKGLQRHADLLKHQSSLLTQIRTGKVGLRAFLFERSVPDITTPLCQCGEAPETAPHLVLDCTELGAQRRLLQAAILPHTLRTHRDFTNAVEDPKRAKVVVCWLLSTGRFPEFRLAERYRAEEEMEAREDRE